MKPDTRKEVGILISDMIASVLRSPLDFRGADDLAHHCGYSRYHLSRLFGELCGESLTGFLRRIKLERAAFRLKSGCTVMEAAISAGFESPESFTRSFSKHFGSSPGQFARMEKNWKIASPEGIHWNEHWDDEPYRPGLERKYETRLERSPQLRLAVVRHVGNYAKLWEGWETVPFEEGKTWFTIYYDTIWSCAHSDLMRSDLGFALPEGDPPAGFQLVEIPPGLTIKTVRFVDRAERNEAWSYVTGCWPETSWGYDEYAAWPLPFEEVRTRVCVRTKSD